jgi:hypothetical protein
MLKSGVQTFVEVGSGNVLIGLIRRITKSTPSESLISCYQLGNQDDFAEFVAENSI